MSLRNIKKLQSPDIPQHTDDSEESEATPKKPSNNFELLSVSEREDDNETTEMENLSASANVKVAQKKRKNKKKRRTGARQKVSSEDVDGDNDDEIARTVKLVDRMFGTDSSHFHAPRMETEPTISPPKALLAVQHKFLNPQTELKRMFGKVVNQEQQRKRRGGNFRSLKANLMTNPKDSWPRVNRSGLYMNLLPTPETLAGDNKNLMYFSFEHSQSYRAIQQKFLQSVESIDSNNIVQIINMQPYHIDALIQLSELCKMSEDNSMAAELIEHALYAFESAFHSMFSTTSGNCRLDYRRQENRAFYIVLFKHAQFLAARACPRTALELSKLILSLDPENDPLAIILLIDFYALRSKQYDFLVQLYREWETSHNLSLLPNMAYSYALALYHMNKMDESDQALQYALAMFPGMLKLLIDELSVQADSRVTSHKYVGPGAFTSSPLALQQLMQLYVARSIIVWSGDNEILLWLERNVHSVLDRVDSKDELINDCIAKRSSRYPHPPRNILRHVILSEFKEKVPIADFLKKENEPIVHFDPLPPVDSVNIYERPKPVNVQQLNRTASGLQLFFQSLFPSFSLQQQQQAVAAPGEQLDEAAGGNVAGAGDNPEVPYAELRHSLNSIVDAMRDFLSDIRVMERNPNEDGGDEDSTSGDEDVNDYLT